MLSIRPSSGPHLGVPFWDYRSDADALADVLRLSRGMTYKSALARLPLGGGKCVVLGNASTVKTPHFFGLWVRLLNSLMGVISQQKILA